MTQEGDVVRKPWTVVVLAAWSAIGFVWALLFNDGWQLGDLLSLAVSAMFIRAYWMGQPWVFHLTFVASLLCAIIVPVTVIAAPEQLSLGNKFWWGATIIGNIFLVRHPATKRFIRGEEDRPPSPVNRPPERGGRVAQAIAISVFGILAVALPLLWAFGDLGGLELLAGVVVCVGSGVWVFILGLPDRSRDRSPAR